MFGNYGDIRFKKFESFEFKPQPKPSDYFRGFTVIVSIKFHKLVWLYTKGVCYSELIRYIL